LAYILLRAIGGEKNSYCLADENMCEEIVSPVIGSENGLQRPKLKG
jgi:hypothetical protein